MSFIKNYGLFWEREGVNWGKRGKGNKGALEGYAVRSSIPIDFRDQAGVYVLYDGIDIPSLRVTYVGQVGRIQDSLFGRLKNHCNDHLWNRWRRFSWFGVYGVGKAHNLVQTNILKVAHVRLDAVLDHLEGTLITLMEPMLNKRGANWGGATHYFQKVEEAADPVMAKLKALQAEVAELSRVVKARP